MLSRKRRIDRMVKAIEDDAYFARSVVVELYLRNNPEGTASLPEENEVMEWTKQFVEFSYEQVKQRRYRSKQFVYSVSATLVGVVVGSIIG